jgi:Arc/MetJ-type ribon-helix-helix transcriptional regulator
MARPKLGDGESQRLQMVITEDEVAAIDEWQHTNRVASRSEAIRRLVQIGLLVEQELEQVVDLATECVEGLTDQLRDAISVDRKIVSPDHADLQFGQNEVRDILDRATARTRVACEAIEGLHHMIVTIYNAVSPFAETKTIKAGLKESRKRIQAANAATEALYKKRLESEENRYIGIIVTSGSAEDEQKYEKLSERQKENYLKKRISALAEEEASDPEAFAVRYNISKPFWETAGWVTRLRSQNKTTKVPK